MLLDHCTVEKNRLIISLCVASINSAQCQPSTAEVSEQDRAQFTQTEATVSCAILLCGPRNLMKAQIAL